MSSCDTGNGLPALADSNRTSRSVFCSTRSAILSKVVDRSFGVSRPQLRFARRAAATAWSTSSAVSRSDLGNPFSVQGSTTSMSSVDELGWNLPSMNRPSGARSSLMFGAVLFSTRRTFGFGVSVCTVTAITSADRCGYGSAQEMAIVLILGATQDERNALPARRCRGTEIRRWAGSAGDAFGQAAARRTVDTNSLMRVAVDGSSGASGARGTPTGWPRASKDTLDRGVEGLLHERVDDGEYPVPGLARLGDLAALDRVPDSDELGRDDVGGAGREPGCTLDQGRQQQGVPADERQMTSPW